MFLDSSMRKSDLYRSFQHSFMIGDITTQGSDLERKLTVDQCTHQIIDDLHKNKEMNRYVVRSLQSPYELNLGDGNKAIIELIPRYKN